jgi:hypothetical protein
MFEFYCYAYEGIGQLHDSGGKGVRGGEGRFSSLLMDKKAREQDSAGKNRNIYGGNRFRNIKKMAGTNFPIGI